MMALFYPIVDVHQHVGPWPFAGRWGGIELNLHYLERRGIDAALISSTEAIVDDLVAGNRRLANDIAGHSALYGYVVVNPRYLELSAQQLEIYDAHPQFVGAKVHTSYSATPIGAPAMADLFELLAAHGKPVLIHTWGAGDAHALAQLAARHPALPIVAAHAGATAWREMIAAARNVPNLYLDFALSIPERGRIERAVEVLGAERVVFGTDATLLDPAYMLACFHEADIDPRYLPQLMGGNTIRLFGLAGIEGRASAPIE
jgi:hypothetical protein